MNENVKNINEPIALENLTSLAKDNEILDPLVPMIEMIMGIEDSNLNEIASEVYKGMLEGMFTKQLRGQAIDKIVTSLKEGAITKNEAINTKNEIINTFKNVVDALKPSEKKRELLYVYIDQIDSIYNEAFGRFNSASIVLPMVLEEGAQVPTYAHDSDTAADLYAAEDTVIPAHSISNMVRTGVHIGLPENWTAIIVPRSSIGMKTGLRLSNSQGVIDSL